MKQITLKIDGKEVKGKEGDTVLDVCRSNDIFVPTLCHLEGTSNVGACRLCVVEIDGERRVNPACTFPAREGLVVRTATESLQRYRRLILELIFTERNHFCMFCEKSGDCELQSMAYRYQMDNVRYPYTFPALALDSISDNVVIDHNRCILCGRCVRACGEVVANHTLDFGKRGWRTTVAADLDKPLGESTCIACGACVQACPTGAIFSKLSQYKGKRGECQKTATVCPVCGVGCALNVLTKDNNLVQVESQGLTDPRGPLCSKGRFGLIRDERVRVSSPMVRNAAGKLENCTMSDALEAAAAAIRGQRDGFAGMISTRYPSETLSLFGKLMREVVRSDRVDTVDGRDYRLIVEGSSQFSENGRGLQLECSAEEILEADCIIVVGADPQSTHPVIGCFIRRAIHERKAKLIVINSERDVFSFWSDLWLKPKAGSEGVLL
ncbi:MAG: 2Fe-2S iron-sulfur cluster-binding protein, partial [Chloroflexi bacterium]|nr:2Fe-2S iron-sulfur cluster-binding protein [Chloroflexota bacterium]